MIILHEAQLEITEAAEYYERCRPGLGISFLDVLDEGYLEIARNPTAYTPLGDGLRKFTVRPYPYAIIYQCADDEIVVVCVMNQKRKPDYWRVRL